MTGSTHPERIGPYAILETLGEGGMGVVYLAEQSEPVRRLVALKVLGADRSSEEILARFQSERQALAVMDHPSIAKIFDAGVTDDGHSYFAMERVEGSPITRYCDEHRLSVRERVRLFAEVCRGVQHAHQKGVIHRDLKPSNVLVAEVDGRPTPRIIDFGIAKAVTGEAFDGTALTRDDRVVGTPAYMSPEQVDGSADVDTRADVYALGILLYEVLVGTLPFDARAYRGWAAVAAALHRDTPTPTRRLAELADTQETVAGLRGTTPAALRRELSGDLDVIVARATARDRTARYETANGLALDLERYLTDEPVRARGAATAYILRKFVRRNRLAVAFGFTVVAGLGVFAVTSKVQAARVARARNTAEARRSQAEHLIDFMLTDLRRKLEPLGRLDILDDVGTQAVDYFSSLPAEQFGEDELLSRSQSLYQIGSVRLNEGHSGEAVAAFRESLRLARELSQRAPADTARLFALSQSHFYVGYASWLNDDLEPAERQFDQYLVVAEKLSALAPENLDYRMEVAFAHSNLASVREARGDFEGAIEALRRTLRVEEDLLARDSSRLDWLGEYAETHNKLAVVFKRQGRYREALEEHRQELAAKEELLSRSPDHAYWRYRRAYTHFYLGRVETDLGDLSAAEAEHAAAVAVLDSLVRQDPSNANWRRARALMKQHLGSVRSRQGRPAVALPLLREVAREMASLSEADSSSLERRTDVGASRVELARALLRAGKIAEADSVAGAARDILEATPSDGRRTRARTVEAYVVMGTARATRGDRAAAVTAWQTAFAGIGPLSAGPGGEEFAPLLAEVLLRLGRDTEARPILAALRQRGYGDPELWTLAGGR